MLVGEGGVIAALPALIHASFLEPEQNHTANPN